MTLPGRNLTVLFLVTLQNRLVDLLPHVNVVAGHDGARDGLADDEHGGDDDPHSNDQCGGPFFVVPREQGPRAPFHAFLGAVMLVANLVIAVGTRTNCRGNATRTQTM